MSRRVVLAALLIACCTSFSGGNSELHEQRGSAGRTSEPDVARAKVREHLRDKVGRGNEDVNPSGNIGDRGKVLDCETEGYSCIARDVCKNWMFRAFLFGCKDDKVCCEMTKGTTCLAGAGFPGKCVSNDSSVYCSSRIPSSDCSLSQLCCRL
ncbi:uncharacterized protein LOC119387804 [Rhipicephalus sanguineus]|uniref:uncharacterized protein LOC119387804 n=1 Tax=Rhipicephalus sanguineus TaxID=34632 RepID=UPI001895B723|nr:uncharacterized protein LOC119387804 [Rhipicephalus sanguineus]